MTTARHALSSNTDEQTRRNHELSYKQADPSSLFSFDEWLRGRNLTRTTGWRYRQQGLIETVNIFGRIYISRSEIKKFDRRAMAGEFAKVAKTPGRRNKGLAA